MRTGQPSITESDDSGTGQASPVAVEFLRERVVVRRRLARKDRQQSAEWVVNRSRRQRMRTLAVCAGALLLMAIGLYFGLAHQESPPPVESAVLVGIVRTV